MPTAATNAIELLDRPIGPINIQQCRSALLQLRIVGKVREIKHGIQGIFGIGRRGHLCKKPLCRPVSNIRLKIVVKGRGHFRRGRPVRIGSVLIVGMVFKQVGRAPEADPGLEVMIFTSPIKVNPIRRS